MDGNIITGAGVASGIDFALAVAAILEGEEVARQIQLQIEYDPSPPFNSGSTETASAETLALLRSRGAALNEQRRAVAERVGKKLGSLGGGPMAVPTKLDHCVIHVSDWERSNAFYRDVMGAELVQRPVGWAYRFGDKQLNVHGKGVSPAEVARLPVQPGNSDLCFEWDGPIEDAIAHLKKHNVADPRRADAAVRRQGRGHQRLFPRSGRLADGIHVVPGALSRWPKRCTIRMCCRTICRCRRTTARRAISQACGFPDIALAATDGATGQSVEAQRPHRRLCLSAHRAARAGAADRLGRDPRRARLHAAVLRLPRSFRRVEAAWRRRAVTGFRPRTAPISARSRSGCICRLRSCRTPSSSSRARCGCRPSRSTA